MSVGRSIAHLMRSLYGKPECRLIARLEVNLVAPVTNRRSSMAPLLLCLAQTQWLMEVTSWVTPVG